MKDYAFKLINKETANDRDVMAILNRFCADAADAAYRLSLGGFIGATLDEDSNSLAHNLNFVAALKNSRKFQRFREVESFREVERKFERKELIN
jgi:hypothetical protein